MKTTLVFALAAAGFLAAGPRHALAQTADEEKVLPLTGSPQAPVKSTAPTLQMPGAAGNVEFRRWHQGQPPLRLIRQDEGFCALTGVGGGFQGGGEEVRVFVGADGYWYLGGKSMQKGVEAECMVVRYPAAPHGKMNPAKRVRVLAASYSFGSEYADVTGRVKTLLRTGKTFQANPESLLVDPHPGWNKALVIFCKVEGKRAIFSVGEGEPVSHDLLAEKARLVIGKTPARTGAHGAGEWQSSAEGSDGAVDAPTF